MLKKTFLLFFFLFTSSCGYEAIHSKKNLDIFNFSIDKLNFIGDRDVNLKIKEKLNSYTTSKKERDFSLDISSTTQKTILAKNTAGDPTSFKSTIIVNVKVLLEGEFKNNLQLIETFNYNNNSNTFDLKKYEREIRNNLSETVTDKLIFKLSNIQ
jgi:hypothetical protein